MAGEVRICTNCGKQQATGAFCERCGTRLPEPLPAQPVVAPTPVAPVEQTAPQQGSVYPDQNAAQPTQVPATLPGPFNKLFDLSFQGFVTRGSLKVLFTSVLVLLGAYWLFALIFGIVAAAKFQAVWCIGIFSSLVLATLMIIWTRIMMELTTTVAEMRDEMQRVAKATEANAAAAEAAAKLGSKSTTKSTAKAAPKTTSKTATKTTSAKAKK